MKISWLCRLPGYVNLIFKSQPITGTIPSKRARVSGKTTSTRSHNIRDALRLTHHPARDGRRQAAHQLVVNGVGYLGEGPDGVGVELVFP